jgi:hypothetical protein
VGLGEAELPGRRLLDCERGAAAEEHRHQQDFDPVDRAEVEQRLDVCGPPVTCTSRPWPPCAAIIDSGSAWAPAGPPSGSAE